MKALQIGDEIKKIEFSVDAAGYEEFTKVLTQILLEFVDAKAEADNDSQETATKKTKEEIKKENIERLTTSIANTPDTVLTLFYAGLLEHHGEYGDGTVLTREDARKLLKIYLTDKTAEEKRTYYSTMSFLVGQIIEDGFIELVGITEMLAPVKIKKKTTAKKTAKVESGVM